MPTVNQEIIYTPIDEREERLGALIKLVVSQPDELLRALSNHNIDSN